MSTTEFHLHQGIVLFWIFFARLYYQNSNKCASFFSKSKMKSLYFILWWSLLSIFRDRALLCSLDYSEIHYVDHAGLKLNDLPTSAPMEIKGLCHHVRLLLVFCKIIPPKGCHSWYYKTKLGMEWTEQAPIQSPNSKHPFNTLCSDKGHIRY